MSPLPAHKRSNRFIAYIFTTILSKPRQVAAIPINIPLRVLNLMLNKFLPSLLPTLALGVLSSMLASLARPSRR